MQRKNTWLAEEDRLITKLFQERAISQENTQFLWREISQQIKEEIGTVKTARQCHDRLRSLHLRWNHRLKPGVKKENDWNQEQINRVFALQDLHGNKWTRIASKLGGRTEIGVKNLFYSTLRRPIRVINSYIVNHRSDPYLKSLKLFKENCVNKIVAQDQGKAKRLKITSNRTEDLAQQLKSNLINIYKDPDNSTLIKKAIRQLLDFNHNCKRLRGKEKTSLKNQEQEMIEEEEASSVPDTEETKAQDNNRRKVIIEKFIKFLHDCLQGRIRPSMDLDQKEGDKEAQLSDRHSEPRDFNDGKFFNLESEFFMNEVPELSSINLEFMDENDIFQFGMDSMRRGKSENSIPFWEKDIGLDGIMEWSGLRKIESPYNYSRDQEPRIYFSVDEDNYE